MSTDKTQDHPTRSVARSAGVIALATLCSRILGFIRDVVIARLFGIYLIAQAFVVAFKIPNLLRDFLAEGASNAAFVPVFSEYAATRSKEEFWELAQVVLTLLLIILSGVTLLGIFLAPVIVPAIAPGFIASPEKLATTIALTRIIFPYILLVSLAAYAMGILNSLKSFTVSAFAPCLMNLSLIVFTLMFGEGIAGLAGGVLAGGLLQLAVQIPALYKKGFRFRLSSKGLNHPAARAIGRLMMPRMLSSGIYQLNNFVDSIFGSLAWIVGEGGVVVLYLSYRLIQFPLGIFSTALSQAVLPTLSTQAAQGDFAQLRRTFSWALRTTFFVTVPASVGFMVLSKPLVAAVFGGGRFDASSASLTASALFYYSIGLFAYGGSRIVQSCFFALKDTRIPTQNAALAFVLNAVLNVALMFPLKIAGIALATSISGVISFYVLYRRLQKKLDGFDGNDVTASFMRIACASVGMGAICYTAYYHLSFGGAGRFVLLARLGAAVCIGCASYVGLCLLFRVREMKQLFGWVREHTVSRSR